MTSSQPISPCSDCSTSSRSEWFRQSVLFWSQDRSGLESDEAINEDNKSIPSPTSSSTLPTSSSTLNKRTSSTEKSEVIKKVSTYDPSELLRQVDELERCLSGGSSIVSLNEDKNCNSLETSSPHLTLEFPVGSSIKNNPLYLNVDKNNDGVVIEKSNDLKNSDGNGSIEPTTTRERLNSTKNEIYNPNKLSVIGDVMKEETETKISKFSGPKNENHNDTNETSTERVSKINEMFEKDTDVNLRQRSTKDLNKNDKDKFHAGLQLVEDVKKVQDTLKEISREIQYSRKKCTEKHARDANIVLGNLLSGIKPPFVDMERGMPSVPPTLPLKTRSYSVKKDTYMKACNEIHMNGDIVSDSFLSQANDQLHCQLKSPYQACVSSRSRISSCSPSRNEVLLKHIDDLIELEHELDHRKTNKYPVLKMAAAIKKTDNRDRFDSGVQSTSSDSNSPYPSPVSTRALSSSDTPRSPHPQCPEYDSGYSDVTQNNTLTLMSSKVHHDSVFHEESDMSSDWSPISTLSSTQTSTLKRNRSNSVPHVGNQKWNPITTNFRMSTGNIIDEDVSYVKNPTSNGFHNTFSEDTYSDSEVHAIRKFITLTSQYFDEEKLDNTLLALDELSLLPGIKEAIEDQKKEIFDQHKKQEVFLHQLGDLLLEIVNLKEEQSTVRTKQAKALSLLKRQLDTHKKNQSQAHLDVLNQVNNLNEKLDLTLTHPQDQASVTATPATSSPIPRSVVNSPVNSNHGHVVWKITDFTKKLIRVKTGILDGMLVSQPFQTSAFGYKMNGWVYLNGRGKMVGNYLSVYVCVLVGDYDAILTWPIRPTYKFTLIDQRSDASKRQDHVKFRHVTDIAGRGGNVISQRGGIPRPSDTSKALIVGYDDFIAHEHLLERRYLVDDVLFLKIEADVA